MPDLHQEANIVSGRPNEYRVQRFSGCGAYSAKAVLEAYGRSVPTDPFDLYPRYLPRWFRGIPSSPQHWLRSFASRGLAAKLCWVGGRGPSERLALLKKALDSDAVVMVRMGNGYLRSGRYVPVIAWFIGHWVTLWGYDDATGTFYVYDSCVPRDRYDRSVPSGNTRRIYEDLLRDMNHGGFPWWWRNYFLVIRERYDQPNNGRRI